MFDESVSSSPTFWATLYSWFTPTIFFLLLQLVIATIYITSTLSNSFHKHHQQQQDPHQPHNFHQQQLYRAPSVLQRLKSINFYSYPYRSHDVDTHTPLHTTHIPPQQQDFATHTPPYTTHIHPQQDFATHNPLHTTHIHPQQQDFATHNPLQATHIPSQQEDFATHTPPYTTHTPPQQQPLARSPSILQRLKSINLYSYFPTEPLTNVFSNEKTREPEKQKQIQKEEDEGVGEGEVDDVLVDSKFSSLDEVFRQLERKGGNFARSHSDTKPEAGEVPVKLPKKMKKSASSKSAFSNFKEEDIVESRRPATTREPKVLPPADADDVEVDAKADDFINKFKQQLKLQRIDSIMRYKDMITRGTEK